jgi:hypothetical protein
MSVYVDDAGIPAKVRNGSRVHNSRWYHLTADTPEELHRFAEGLGLKRSYFQPGKGRGDGTPSPFWHYDLTEGKRQQAIKQGAQQVAWRDMPGICRNRVPQGPECTLADPCGLEGCRACYPELAQETPLHSHADLAEMADQLSAESGQAWRDGKHLEAARLMRQAAEADESRPDLWGKRLAWIHDHARDLPLAVGTQVRLAAAGIRSTDPEMGQVAYHNYRARIRAGHAVKPAEAEPAKQPERALDDTEPGQ